MYLAHTDKAVSSIIFIGESGKPVYFLSKKLVGVELSYKSLHKVALALVHSTRRLQHYFQGRAVKVYTEYPLKRILQTGQESGHLYE